MALNLNLLTTASVTLDESLNLQNATLTPAPAGDADDNDIASAALPAPFAAALTLAGIINAAESGYNGANGGLNAFTFNVPDATGLAFTDVSGAALAGLDSGLRTSAGGAAILLYSDVANDNIVYGKVGGTTVFAAYLEETGAPLSGARLWMVQYQAIQNTTAAPDEAQDLLDKVFVTVTQSHEFSLANAPSGQSLFLALGDAEAAIIVTGMHPANVSQGASVGSGDTINTSQGGGATTIGANNQMVDPNEGIYFTFVTGASPGLTIPNLDAGEAKLESNIQFSGMLGAEAGDFNIVQLQKGKSATVTVSAFTTAAHPGNDYVDFIDANTKVNVSGVTVKNAAGADVTANVSIHIVAGVATVAGIHAGDRISYTTDGEHNRVLIGNGGTGLSKASFDIGGFSLAHGGQSTAEIGSLMRFEDAGPSVTLAPVNDSGSITTHDADTVGGSASDSHDFSANFTVASNSFNSDGDGGTTWSYALNVTSAGEDSGLTSGGAAVHLYLVGAVVVGSTALDETGIAAANTVFELALSGSAVELLQYAAIDHDLPGVGSNYAAQTKTLAGNLIALTASVVLLDGDGDSASSSADLDLGGNIVFLDDGPTLFSPDAITLLNSGSALGSEDLHAAGTAGADAPGALAFVDNHPADNYLYANDNATALKSGGEDIVLSGFGTSTLVATTATSLQTVFTATLDAGTDQYTIDFERAIGDGSHVDILGAAPVRSGNPTYNIINNVGGTTIDLLFSGGDTSGGLPGAHSVNVSTNGAGVDNQSLNASAGKGETLRIDFEIGATLAGGPLGSDFTPGAHKTVNGYSFMITQNSPGGTTATAFIKVFDADDDKVLVGDAGDSADTITEVKVGNFAVYDSGGVHATTINGRAVAAIVYGGGIVITGLNEGSSGDGVGGDDPVVTVSTANGFNRVEVSNFAGQSINGVLLGGTGFDLAPVDVDLPVAGTPVGFSLAAQLTDFDGDFSPAALIGVNLTPLPV
jgi:hypothetical protein